MTDRIKKYPLKLWSHPFKFIFLPWVLVFLVIFYWFSFVPLLFAYYIKKSQPATVGKYVFLISQLIIFVVIICVLVYIWRKRPNKDSDKCKTTNKEYCMVARLEEGLQRCDDCVDVPEVAEKRPMLFLDLNKEDEVVNVRSHVAYDEQRPLSQNLEVALTPRELFFRDLYESVFETDSSVTKDFIQKEREFSSLLLQSSIDIVYTTVPEELSNFSASDNIHETSLKEPFENRKYSRVSVDETKFDGTEDVSEFFVANITQNTSVSSEVFLYVSDDSEKKPQTLMMRAYKQSGDDIFL